MDQTAKFNNNNNNNCDEVDTISDSTGKLFTSQARKSVTEVVKTTSDIMSQTATSVTAVTEKPPTNKSQSRTSVTAVAGTPVSISSQTRKSVTEAKEMLSPANSSQDRKSVTEAMEASRPTTRTSVTATADLMESLLAQKMAGQQLQSHFVRSDSLASVDSVSSVSSCLSASGASSDPDACKCDDCVLGITDRFEDGRTFLLAHKRKASGWRKVRSVVQWTPFIQTYKHKKYQWVQLAGHSGNFKPGQNQGTVLKKRCPKEELCYEQFIGDSLADYVPRFQGTVVSDDDEKFIQLQDCLSSFNLPSIMDCKIGVRTYLEEELAKAKEKPKLRKDMYEKMVLVDPTAPTENEHQMKGVTKPRYMVWRETISSTATLGFRLEGVKRSDGTSSKDFKTTKTRQQVTEAFHSFLAGSVETAKQYLVRLKEINEALKVSKFFKTHELIGSSLLFVHDAKQASIWLIDFGKTVPVPDGLSIDHRSPWEEGNHEDGYMIGVENLISIFGELAAGRTTTTTPSEPGRAPAENAAALAAGRTSRSAAESVAAPAETAASAAAPAAPREDLSAAK